jgi:diacylglycerol kinase family enzyme
MALKQTLVLVNPNARSGKMKLNWSSMEKQIRDALANTSSSVQVEFTTPEDHGAGIVRKALQEGKNQIVIVGGDGTLSEAIQGLFYENQPLFTKDTVFALIPGGRGDDFFKSLTQKKFYSSRSAWMESLRILKSGKPQPVDLGKIRWLGDHVGNRESPQQCYFINIASFGFPGLVVERVQSQKNILNRWGLGKSAWVYGLHGALALKDYKPLSVQLSVDDKLFYEGPIYSGFILNGKYNAGGINWDPRAQIDDGFFHLLLLEPRSFMRVAQNTLKILMNRGDSLSGAHRGFGKKFKIVLQEGPPKAHSLFEIDGDLRESEKTQGAEIEVLAGCIQFLK